MWPSTHQSSALVKEQLDDDMADFLQGPGPATNSFAKSNIISVTDVLIPSRPSTNHDTRIHIPATKASVFTPGSQETGFHTLLDHSSSTDQTYIIMSGGQSQSNGGQRKNSLASNNPFKIRAKKREMELSVDLNTPNANFDLRQLDATHNDGGTFTSRDLKADGVSPPAYELLGHAELEPHSNKFSETHTPPKMDGSERDSENSHQTLHEILIVVMGPRASGKSTFITSASSTPDYQIMKVGKTGMQSSFVKHLGNDYHLLDTPGFENELEADIVTQQALLWLMDYYGSGQKPENTIILYLHSIGQPRLYGSIRRSLDAFKSLMSPKTWPQIVLGTTGWTAAEKQRPGLAAKRESELISSSLFWKDMYDRGAGIIRIPEQDVFVLDTLRRLRERAISRRPLRLDSTMSGIIVDETASFERKADFLEYERRVLELVTKIRSGGHRPRIAPPSSAFRLICNECKENIGMETVYQCRECYRDTSQRSFILCSTCYREGKCCDEGKHWQLMKKKRITPVSCQSHIKTRFKDWEAIPCSCCDGYCDIVFLHCCECLHDGFNICVKCLLRGQKCESERHLLHIVRWWKGQGGLDSESLPPLVSDHLNDERDDLMDDLSNYAVYGDGPRFDEPEDLRDASPRTARAESDDSITGLGIRNRISKATAEFLKSAWDSD